MDTSRSPTSIPATSPGTRWGMEAAITEPFEKVHRTPSVFNSELPWEIMFKIPRATSATVSKMMPALTVFPCCFCTSDKVNISIDYLSKSHTNQYEKLDDNNFNLFNSLALRHQIANQ